MFTLIALGMPDEFSESEIASVARDDRLRQKRTEFEVDAGAYDAEGVVVLATCRPANV